MKNIKSIAICAASGFVLSLICGFFSKSGFGRIFLIALIFGIVFGALGFGISILFDKFLAIEPAVAEPVEGSGGDLNLQGTPAPKSTGQHVDIVIQDEPLEPSGNPNRYDVGENHQMLNESDYNNSNTPASTEEKIIPKNEFVPIRNLETVSNFSGNESTTPKEAEERREAIQRQEEEKGEELDTLPDMSDFKVASEDGGSEDDTVIISNSDEAQFVQSATNFKSSESSTGEIKDASLMAKAISSILAEET